MSAAQLPAKLRARLLALLDERDEAEALALTDELQDELQEAQAAERRQAE